MKKEMKSLRREKIQEWKLNSEAKFQTILYAIISNALSKFPVYKSTNVIRKMHS